MIISRKIVIFLMLLASLLMGCGVSKDEAITSSQEMAKEVFNQAKITSNHTTMGISYYLPTDFKVKNELENNIIFSKGKQEYILFVNPHEQANSEVIYNTLKEAEGQAVVESFAKEKQFGYISVQPIKDKEYELIVGIGGVKMTTKTSSKQMVENTKTMMEIVNSVENANGAIQ